MTDFDVQIMQLKQEAERLAEENKKLKKEAEELKAGKEDLEKKLDKAKRVAGVPFCCEDCGRQIMILFAGTPDHPLCAECDACRKNPNLRRRNVEVDNRDELEGACIHCSVMTSEVFGCSFMCSDCRNTADKQSSHYWMMND